MSSNSCLSRTEDFRSRSLYPVFKGVYTPRGGTEKSTLSLRVLICRRSGKRVYETPRTAKKISTGICLISESSLRSAYLRALFFEHDAEIRQVSEPARLRKDHLWTGTNSQSLDNDQFDLGRTIIYTKTLYCFYILHELLQFFPLNCYFSLLVPKKILS